jgi:hypothetical protein
MLGEASGGVLGVLWLGLVCGCASPAKQGAAPTPVSAAVVGGQERPIPADLQAAVARSSEIGSQLYVLDQVASLGTDVLLANVKHPEEKKIIGYLPLREADDAGQPTDTFQVAFFTSDQPPRIAYRIHIAPNGKPTFESIEPPMTAPEEFAALAGVRQAAIAALAHPSQPLNPVLIPGEAYGESGTLVYLLAGTTKSKVAVFGKHYRALVAMGSNRVTYLTELSKAVLEVPLEHNGQPAVALTISHLVTEYPLETHVFTSLLIHLPVYVQTSRGSWRVNGEQIAFLGADS